MTSHKSALNKSTLVMIAVAIVLFAMTDWTHLLQSPAGEEMASPEEATSNRQPFSAQQERSHEQSPSNVGEPNPLVEIPAKGEIVRLMRQVNAQRCAEADEQRFTGKAFVQIKIMNTGQVVTARALPPIKDTPMGDCLETEIKQLKFSKFKKEFVNFKFPFMVL